MNVGALEIEIYAGVARLQEDMRKATGIVNDASSKMQASLRGLQSAMQAIGVGIGVGALVAWTKQVINTASELNDLSEKVGMTASEVSGLTVVFQQAGVDSRSFQAGLVQMSKAATDNEGAFRALGIQLRDSAGAMRPTREVLLEVADIFSRLPGGMERAKLATELFGRAGADLIPVLIKGKAGIEELVAEAQRMGAVMSDEAVKAADDLGDSLDMLLQTAKATSLSLFRDTIPVVNEFLKALGMTGVEARSAAVGADLLANAFRVAAQVTAVVIINVLHLIRMTAGEVETLAKQTWAFFKGGWEGARQVREQWTTQAQAMREEVLRQSEAIFKAADKQKQYAEALRLAGNAAENDEPVFRRLRKAAEEEASAKARAAIAASEKAAADRSAAAEAKRRAEVEERLRAAGAEALAAVNDEIALMNRRITLGRDLTSAERDYERVLTQIRQGKLRLTEAQLAELRVKLQYRDALAEEVALSERSLKASRDAAAARASEVQASIDSVKSLREQVAQQRAANLALSTGRDEVARLEVAKLREMATSKERAAIVAMERAQDETLAQSYREEAAALRELADAKERGIAERAAQQTVREYEKATDQIGQALANALMEGGKSAAEYLQGLFRNLVLRPVIQAVAAPATALFSGSASAGGLLDAMGGLSKLGDLFGKFGSFMSGSMINAYASEAVIRTADWLATSSNNFLAGLGNTLQGFASQLGGILGALGNAGAGFGLSRLIGGGYQTGAGGLVDALGAVASAFVGPIGGVVSGLFNRAFGRKLKDVGFEGTFKGGDFEGSLYQFYKGGWFRSDKTKRKPLDASLAAVMDAGGMAMLAQVREFARTLGLPAEALDEVAAKIKVSTKKLSPEQIQERIAEAIRKYGEALASEYEPLLKPLQKAGESLLDTMTRLSVLERFSVTLNEMGGIFADVARLSVDAKERLFEMAGGMQALGAAAMSFVQEYYSREEIAGLKAREISQMLQSLGLSADIGATDPRAQYRALVESLDVSTEQGQKQLLALLGASTQFAQVADYMQQTGLTLSQVAAQAPATAAMQTLFNAQQASAVIGQQQVSELETANGHLTTIADLLRQILARTSSNAAAPEVNRFPLPLRR